MEQENNQQPYTGMPNNVEASTPDTQIQMQTPKPKKEGSVGPIIGSIIIIFLIILGGLYFWGSIVERSQVQENTNPATDVSGIEEDLDDQAMEEELNQMDKDMMEIEAEINAALE